MEATHAQEADLAGLGSKQGLLTALQGLAVPALQKSTRSGRPCGADEAVRCRDRANGHEAGLR